MATERLDIDCESLENIRAILHLETKVVDLTDDEKAKVFPVINDIRGQSGGVLLETSLLSPYKDTTLRELYDQNCTG